MIFCAYYYAFDSTGVDAIDKILKAVAAAGKSYHDTDCWNNEYTDGSTPVSRIQDAANIAANFVKGLIDETDSA